MVYLYFKNKQNQIFKIKTTSDVSPNRTSEKVGIVYFNNSDDPRINKVPKRFKTVFMSVSLEEGKVYHNKLWLTEDNDKRAKELFDSVIDDKIARLKEEYFKALRENEES